MKPQYEHVTFASGCSIRVYHRQLARIPFEWHRHPEYELTLTLNSRGRRFIGDHVAHYADDDLVLVPPNLPHTWSSNARIDRDAPEVALVIWFDGDWARRLADCCPEYAALRSLLRRAAPGLHFDTDAARAMRARLPQLLDPSPRTRLSAALDTLADLAEAGGEPLATAHAYDQADGTTPPANVAAPRSRTPRPRARCDRPALPRTVAHRRARRHRAHVRTHFAAPVRPAPWRKRRPLRTAAAARARVPSPRRHRLADRDRGCALRHSECRELQSPVSRRTRDDARRIPAILRAARPRARS